ncbi:hypothetical protein Agub_g13736, partial [Astrephomene gubernaculifera]
MLPQSAQARVFAPQPAGHRLIIVATNVAETSLTIPGIRYVVDAGRSKQRLLEDASAEAGGGGAGGQVARYEVRWISKAAAAQRAGRAGRTCPGHTYRLFSSAHFNDTFPDHSPPEIVNTSLEGVVLVMKSMGVDKVHNFPFPTPPDPAALLAAHRCLEALGALEPEVSAGGGAGGGGGGRLTEVGRAMAAFPISPRHARMLLEVLKWHKSLHGDAAAPAAGGDDLEDGGVSGGGGNSGGALAVPDQVVRRAGRALPYALALAAAVSVESPFIHIDTVGGGDDDKDTDPDQDERGNKDDEDGEGGHNKKNGHSKRGARPDKKGQRRKKSKGMGQDEAEEEEEEEEEEDGEDEAGRAGPGPGSVRSAVAAAAAREAARRRRQHAASMQARFRHPHSDALSALAALVAFEASGESEEFATSHFLHGRNLREAADLHRQLIRLLATQQANSAGAGGGGGGSGGSGLADELAAVARELAAGMVLPSGPSSAAVAGKGSAAGLGGAGGGGAGGGGGGGADVSFWLPERVAGVLRRALAAGWADQVARRVRSAEYLAQLGESRRKRHAVRYQPACAAAETGVFLHPRSSLHGDAPELLVYAQLLRTDKRTYMAGLTAIEPEWLSECGTPLCRLSATPLPEPPATYRPPPLDSVVCWREARYGLHGWPLPPVMGAHPEARERAAGFAAALLEGRVAPCMTELRPHLMAAPSMLLRPELRGVVRVGELLSALTRAKVDSAASLRAAWAAQPALLQREVAAWLPKTQHATLMRMWPVVAQQVRQ